MGVLATEASQYLVLEQGGYLVTEDYEDLSEDFGSSTSTVTASAQLDVIPARVAPPSGYDVAIKTATFSGGLEIMLDRFGRPV